MKSVQENRAILLDALRSGEYPKGPIVDDDQGRPIDPGASGYCVVGLAYNLFGESIPTMRKALGLRRDQFRKMQQDWNDSPLTFPEIADRIETLMFCRK